MLPWHDETLASWVKSFIKYNLSFVNWHYGVGMTKEKILAQLKSLGDRFKDPKIQRRFEGYNKTVQFIFPDIDLKVYMKIGDAKLEQIAEGEIDSQLKVTMDTSVFLGIMNKTESPMSAYSSGKLKTVGEVPDLLKLQKLLV